MDVFTKISDIRSQRWADPTVSWGLVPTMGYLHDGHLSLVRRARQENDRLAASVFVNPTQFNDQADLSAYPRNLARDLALLKEEGVDLVWTPAPEIVYPPGFQTFVEVDKVSRVLEGASRPGHLRGVTTMVTKLFNLFQPQRAYFGQKDAQQVVTIRQLVLDLNFNLEIVACPTVREADGLAMSSRNANLSPEARRQAVCLYRALLAARAAFAAGQRRAVSLRDSMLAVIESTEMTQADYVSIADPDTLDELETVESRALLSLAVFVGGVRLIDNMLLGA